MWRWNGLGRLDESRGNERVPVLRRADSRDGDAVSASESRIAGARREPEASVRAVPAVRGAVRTGDRRLWNNTGRVLAADQGSPRSSELNSFRAHSARDARARPLSVS